MTSLLSGITYKHFETVDSTNSLAREHLEHGTLIVADEQTAGRGRYGNDWVSPKGNLYMSFVWRVSDLAVASQYAFVTAVVLSEALKDLCHDDLVLSLKWPNDIYLDGKKLAGILLETEERDGVTYLIIGCGVNLSSSPDYACDLKNDAQLDVTAEEMAQMFAVTFRNWNTRLEQEGFEAIRDRWLLEAHGMGQKMKVRLSGEEFTGIFTGLDHDGGLLLEQEDGTVRTVTSGEVFFT